MTVAYENIVWRIWMNAWMISAKESVEIKKDVFKK